MDRVPRSGTRIVYEDRSVTFRHQDRIALRINLLDFNSSVEVGYGFHAICSKLLIVNDMY